MTLTQVTFEAAADNLAITSANAATYGLLGGGSTALAGGTITAKSGAAADGTRGIEIASVAAATTLTRAGISSANQVAAISVAFKLVTAPTGTTNIQIMGVRYASGFTLKLNWDSSTTKFRINNAASTAIGTDYNSAATATWYRIEIVENTGSGTTTGSGTVNLYLLAGTTPLKTWTIAAENLNGPNAIAAVEIAASNGAVIQYDSIQMNDGATTEIGRLVAGANAVPVVNITTATPYQVAGSNVALSGTITDSDGTVSSAQWQYSDDDETGAFGGSWSNLTTVLSGGGTASATATATDTAVPAGVRRYRLTGVDNSAGSTSATLDAYIYAASGSPVAVRYVTNTGSYTNTGSGTPASSLQQAMNDTSPNSGYNTWAESPAAPAGAVLTLVFDPIGPGPIILTADLQLDTASPGVNVTAVAKTLGGTTVFNGGTLTPTTTANHYPITFDSGGNTAATQTVRQALRLDLTATQV